MENFIHTRDLRLMLPERYPQETGREQEPFREDGKQRQYSSVSKSIVLDYVLDIGNNSD